MKDNRYYLYAILLFISLALPLCLIDNAISEEAAKRDTAESLLEALRKSFNDGDVDAYLSLHYYKDTGEAVKLMDRVGFADALGSERKGMRLVEYGPEKIEKKNAEIIHDCKYIKPTLPVLGGIAMDYKKGYNEGVITMSYGVHEGVYYIISASQSPVDKENPVSFNVMASSPDRTDTKLSPLSNKPVKVECVFIVSGKEVREQKDGSAGIMLNKCGQEVKSCQASLLEPEGNLMLQVYRDGLLVFNTVSADEKKITYSEH